MGLNISEALNDIHGCCNIKLFHSYKETHISYKYSGLQDECYLDQGRLGYCTVQDNMFVPTFRSNVLRFFSG